MEVNVMKNVHSLVAALNAGVLSAALAMLAGGCSCGSSACGVSASPAQPQVPEKKVQQTVPAKPVVEKKAVTAAADKTAKAPEKKAATAAADKTAKAPEQKKAEPVSVDIAPTISTVWTLDLDSLDGIKKSWTEPDKNITLIYDPEKKQIAGCSGVNRYFGPVAIDQKKKTFKAGALGVTKMAGPGMDYENLFLNLLSKVDSYAIKNGKLMLKSGSDTVAVFTTGVKETK